MIFIFFILLILFSKYSAMSMSHLRIRKIKTLKKLFSVPAFPLLLARTLLGEVEDGTLRLNILQGNRFTVRGRAGKSLPSNPPSEVARALIQVRMGEYFFLSLKPSSIQDI